MKYRESRLSAHHNYLVNGIPTPGFVLGDPHSENGFYFLADMVLPGESTPRISCRILDEHGGLVAEMDWNRIRKNPGRCSLRSTAAGFRALSPSDDLLLEVRTESFANGYLTRINARLFDETGELRAETFGESIQVHGRADLALVKPFDM